jgi:hypothetical protein
MMPPVPDRRELTFPIAMDRIIMWLIAGLVSWLCYSTMTMREQMVVMIERSDNSRQDLKIVHTELERLTAADKAAANQLREIQIKQAEHGWK